ncbi:MAG: tetratricopeptide repeat protein, partial [Planctomycetota bacterium]
CIPEHIYVRHDDGKTWFNVETTTSIIGAPEEDYRQRYDYTDADSEAYGYGRNMSEKEFSAVIHMYGAAHLAGEEKNEEALEIFDKALELWPENPEIILRRISLLHEGLGRNVDAQAELGKLAPRCSTDRMKTSVLVTYAGFLQVEEKHNEALARLKNAYKIAPKSMEHHVLSAMSTSYRALRMFQHMLLANELAAILHGGKEDDLVGLAIAYKNAGELDAAIAALRIAHKKNPEDWNIRLILAGYLIRAGQEEEGWKIFETVEKPRANLQHFETNMAWFYGSVGRKKKFLEHLENALKLGGQSVLSYVNREADFDRYRDDADFKALIKKYSEGVKEPKK